MKNSRIPSYLPKIFIILLLALVGMTLWIWVKNKSNNALFQNKIGALEGLGHYGQVPDFSLTERNGQTLGLADLKGKVWIMDFMYTHCPDSCPLQTAKMAELQKNLSGEKDVRLVSITVDPERDTPEVLSEYARSHGADPQRWFFLTGEKEYIHRLAQEGFHLSAVEIPHEKRDARGASHIHGSQLVLVDRQGQIRGYYSSNDPDALRRLLQDVKTLLEEKVSSLVPGAKGKRQVAQVYLYPKEGSLTS
jgi:protein SCO1/2